MIEHDVSKKRNLLISIHVRLTEQMFDIILLDKKYPHLTKDDEKQAKSHLPLFLYSLEVIACGSSFSRYEFFHCAVAKK